jgi:hypothetical protein
MRCTNRAQAANKLIYIYFQIDKQFTTKIKVVKNGKILLRIHQNRNGGWELFFTIRGHPSTPEIPDSANR